MNQLLRERVSLQFLVLTVLFCICLIVANLMEIKTVMFGPLTITAGMAVFPVSYIINDCLVEVYGFHWARRVIWLGFFMNLLVTLLLQLAIVLPGAESWEHQDALAVIYGGTPRILVASFAAFICGSMVNARVMSHMKRRVGNSLRGFSTRAVVSTLWGEGVDSLVFFPIAFGGLLPPADVVELIIVQTFLKTIFEIILLPATTWAVGRLQSREHPLISQS